MFEGKIVKTDKKGKVSYNRNILNNIVTLAAGEVEGVCALSLEEKKKQKMCKVDFIGDDIYVEVYIRVIHGHRVVDIAYKIQENIKRSVETTTTFKVKEVNVHVNDVVIGKEQQKHNTAEQV